MSRPEKRYFYLTDPEGGNAGDKEFGELWSFAASVLPRIHECDPDVAVTIRANTEITSPDAPVSEGYRLLKEKLESVYSCMGVSCGQVNKSTHTHIKYTENIYYVRLRDETTRPGGKKFKYIL